MSSTINLEFNMTATEQTRFDKLYNLHLRALKLRGMSDKTIDSYARAVRRVSSHFDCCPDQLTTEQLESYFAELVDSHSWSTVKIDRNGLQFFWKYVLKTDWQWVNNESCTGAVSGSLPAKRIWLLHLGSLASSITVNACVSSLPLN